MYEEVMTDDGSITFRNAEVDEVYHSKSGAVMEARKKYAELVSQFIVDKKELVIYDVCFGLGYNSAAAIDELSDKKLSFYCFENDKGILSKILLINPSFNNYTHIKAFINQFLMRETSYYLPNNKLALNMVYGDFTQEIDDVEPLADYVFFDPFSPKKSPDLWSFEVFEKVYNKMNSGAVLFTYSCARSVRDNMKQAGFEVIDGPIIGRRSPSTIAKKP